MATSPALINAVVAATGEPKESVQVTMRRLREAKLVPVGGRGPYAAPMDYRSATRLLLGVCASVPLERDAAKIAVFCFEDLVGTRIDSQTMAGTGWDPDKTLILDELAPEHTVGDALIRLLEAGGRDELFVFTNSQGKRDTSYSRATLRGYLHVAFYLPLPVVRIEHQVVNTRKVWIYGNYYGGNLENYITILREKGMGGRKQVTEIDQETFEMVGTAVAK